VIPEFDIRRAADLMLKRSANGSLWPERWIGSVYIAPGQKKLPDCELLHISPLGIRLKAQTAFSWKSGYGVPAARTEIC